ncbi:TPA: AIDA-I family autotransporter adhesin YfaL/EhaC [Escherichia coli]|uniref:AIDA-I family autotransporter adhesin YfaL/EhaC n=1 Tax=Escherichia coli TaxID=562 RepID=UPI001CA453F9|nr:AIDA-I family autotransporter adhesin YfaL/EhaC [Escherichia coli]EHC2532285.1 AIDA-I family autotransporter adhesin YfaL/EhaC [Escherichia coli]EHZ8347636.1 AIDA-I family autotransporter adhesin YfaL/EhaC [Escherichia coli]ELX9822755.1 AIDA-I family autotransporter adhesin YfaL/EhaC [Escherichia coli]MBY8612016.1 AIDA-I family autotransporter adhesin YfaL/EhaC [Escherichia coli]MDX7974296.1 AIDA-I family autotransporter adhesin YfaL/EhaC [Escherichia coli]
MRIIFLRKEYLSLLPSMFASLFSANGVAAAIDLCQGYDIKASCHASRQSLSGITQDWSVADGQWLVFSDMTNNASGGAVFLQQGAEFSLLPENETGMTLFANNTVTGEYNNGGAIFAKENSTLNLTDVIFSGNVAGGYGGAIYSSGTNDTGAVDLRVTNAVFSNNIANDGKGGAIYTINNDVYLSDVIFDNNQAYTSTSYSDGDGGAIDVTDNNSDSKHPSGYTIINNTAFTNNTAEGYGGAIYTNSATAPYLIYISVDDSYSQNGGVLVDENNSAAGYGDGPSSAAGGFMYIDSSQVRFDIAANKTLVIGNLSNDGAIDSIAGNGSISKTGAGELVLNTDNNNFTGEMRIENGEVTLGRSNSLMNVGDDRCQNNSQNCYGLMVGSISHRDDQAELNVGATQQTFVHSLTGFQNGTLNIDAGGNVTVNAGGFSGTIEGEGQLTIAENGSYVLAGAQSMALTGDIVVEDGAMLSLTGNAADLAAMQDDPQSIVLNGGVLDLSDFTTWQSGTAENDGLEISGSGGTVIGQQDVVDLYGGDELHIGDDGNNGVYVVVNAGDGQVSLANDNQYLGTTQIASGTLMVSDNSQLGDTHYNRQVIFTDNQQDSTMEITSDVDTRSDAAGHGRDIEMRADGEVAVDAGVDTQWGALMADSSGQHQDEGSTFSKTGAGTLELTASGTTQSAVRVEEGTLKGDVADILPYASSLWVGNGATFVTGADQDIQSIDATSSGTIDISDGTVLRLTGQDTSVALNASLFNGDGTLVNATDGVTLAGEFNTNLETDSLTYLADVTVNGDLTNTSGAVSLQNGVAGDTLTVNGDYTGGGTLLLDSELNGDDSVSDQLVMNGNTAGNTTVVVNSITGIGEPTSTGIKVVDFAADPTQFQNNAQFSLAGSGYVNMGAYDYTLVEDNNDWYLRSQEVTPPSPPDPDPTPDPDPSRDPDPTPDPAPTPAYKPVLNAKVGGYFNNLRAANQAFVMERRDHAGGDGQTLNLRVIGGDYHYTAAGQLAQHEDTSTVQLSGDLFSGRWGTDGEWMLGIVGGYSDNQGDSRSNMTGTRADNQNHGYAVGLTSSWFQHGNQKQGAWLDSWLQYAWFSNDVSEQEDGTDHYHSSGIIASLEAGYQWLPGRGVVIEPQAQVIYQGVQQDDFTAANRARVSQSQGDDIQTRLGLHSEWRTAVHVIPTLDLNYYHDPHSTEIEEDGSTISDDAVKQRGEIKVGVTGNISQRVSLRGSVAWQKGSDDFAQTAGFLSMTVKW